MPLFYPKVFVSQKELHSGKSEVKSENAEHKRPRFNSSLRGRNDWSSKLLWSPLHQRPDDENFPIDLQGLLRV